MNTYKRHRFPPVIIQYAIWLYFRFSLSHRDIEDILAQRGVQVCRESIRTWCHKFGKVFSKRLKTKHPVFGDTYVIDEVFVKIRGTQHYLWRAVDQDGEVIDLIRLITSCRCFQLSTICLTLVGTTSNRNTTKPSGKVRSMLGMR